MEDGELDETGDRRNAGAAGALETTLRKYWGYERFLPLQREAIECVVAGRDSVVVLPTGGGKSLCYQVPAVIMPGLAIALSALIQNTSKLPNVELDLPKQIIGGSTKDSMQNGIYFLYKLGLDKIIEEIQNI